MGTTEITRSIYTDEYGYVSPAQLKAYKRHNVSPSDHETLAEHFGRRAHEEMTEAVGDPNFMSGHSQSFQVYLFQQWAAKNPRPPAPAPESGYLVTITDGGKNVIAQYRIHETEERGLDDEAIGKRVVATLALELELRG